MMPIIRDVPKPFPNRERLPLVRIEANEVPLIVLDIPAHPCFTKKRFTHEPRFCHAIDTYGQQLKQIRKSLVPFLVPGTISRLVVFVVSLVFSLVGGTELESVTSTMSTQKSSWFPAFLLVSSGAVAVEIASKSIPWCRFGASLQH